MPSSPFLDIDGNTIPESHVLGNGSTAVVILQDGLAVKMPLRYLWSVEEEYKGNLQNIHREQNIYRRLQPRGIGETASTHIVDCVNALPCATQLAYMPNGDLRSLLIRYQPSDTQKLRWFCEMASGLAFIHSRRVLVGDIASRNFLVDTSFSIKFCDFTGSSLFPLDTDMNIADDDGYTVQIDIALLGAVFYETVTGTKCEVDLYSHGMDRAHWPDRQSLPSTDDLWLGSVIESCWTGGFTSATALLQALMDYRDELILPPTPSQAVIPQPRIWRGLSAVHTLVSERPASMATAVVLVLTAASIWLHRRVAK